MGLKQASFQLDTDQLVAINEYFSMRKNSYVRAEEDTGFVGLKVEFEWVGGLGRFVTAHFDGEVNGCEIEVAGASTSGRK